MNVFAGSFQPPPGRFALVAARFNHAIVQQLVDGAVDGLKRHGVRDEMIDLYWVPGSLEIPLVAKSIAGGGRHAAVLCLGCVIRGETDHYDHVAGQAAAGISQAALSTGVPIIFGLLTCDTVEQALNRAGLKAGNKGFDAALTAIEMTNLLGTLNDAH
jgi:6,7-dimethyl-8-ribityllumazine synthase